MERDRAQHGESRGFVSHRFRNFRAKVGRNTHHFRVTTVRRNAVADFEAGDVLPDFDHHAGVAISERQGLIELIPNSVQHRQYTVCPDLIQHHSDLVRLLPCFFDQTCLTKVHQHAFRPSGDQSPTRANEELPAFGQRRGHLGKFGSTVPQIL